MELPRQGHLSKKWQPRRMIVHAAPKLHPRDHHAPPLRRQHGLGSIEIQAVVDGLILIKAKGSHIVRLPDETEGPVPVDILETIPLYLLGADEKYLPAVQREVIRTFPHPSPAIAAGSHSADKAPGKTVVAFVQQYRAASVLGPVTDDGLQLPIRQRDLGVPEIPGAPPHRQQAPVNDGITGMLLVIQSVAESNALGL